MKKLICLVLAAIALTGVCGCSYGFEKDLKTAEIMNFSDTDTQY